MRVRAQSFILSPQCVTFLNQFFTAHVVRAASHLRVGATFVKTAEQGSNRFMKGLEAVFSVSEAIVGVCALCGSRVLS